MSAKPEGTLKHFGYAFLLAVIVYVCFFSCDSHLRHRKGAWQVMFGSEASEPMITINEPNLGIRNVRVIFAGEKTTNLVQTVVFDVPAKEIPFGRVKFEDLTYLPGSEVFDFFGHEVQLMPHALTVNKKEIPWKNEEVIQARADEKLPPVPEKTFRSQSRGAFGRSAE
jgi:hypothetical protein